MNAVERRSIGSLQVSALGLGTNSFGTVLDERGSAAVLDAALDHGINFIDTADVYGEGSSEEIIGRWLEGRRNDVVIATKFGVAFREFSGGAKPEYVRSALTRSLQRLRTDWIDLYILHRPDSGTPLEETLWVLDDICREGLVREIGCSGFTLDQLEAALSAVAPDRRGFVNLQNELSLLKRDDEAAILPFCADHGIGYVPYMPLAKGLQTGKYSLGEEPAPNTRLAKLPEVQLVPLLQERNFEIVARLAEFADRRHVPLAEVALSWLLTRPAMASVITGASKSSQIAANVAAVDLELTADDLAEIDLLTAIP